jgi:hypothetical protein
MWKKYRVLAGAALVMMVGTPLCFDGGIGIERAIATRLESLITPTANAAVIVPVETVPAPEGSHRSEAARLFMSGTMLFGLAAVLRRNM